MSAARKLTDDELRQMLRDAAAMGAAEVLAERRVRRRKPRRVDVEPTREHRAIAAAVLRRKGLVR